MLYYIYEKSPFLIEYPSHLSHVKTVTVEDHQLQLIFRKCTQKRALSQFQHEKNDYAISDHMFKGLYDNNPNI